MNPTSTQTQDPRELALAALAHLDVATTGLIEYQAGNRLLLIGGQQVDAVAARLPAALQVIRAIDAAAGEQRLSGHLGAFQLQQEAGGVGQAVSADLVLDLGAEPLLTAPLKPPGYFAPGDDAALLEQALEEVGALSGTFDKPEYVHYDPDRCAHARNGIVACTRCLDACPAEAIQSLAEQIKVDPFLCQGGGVCASVCPSGAITYAYPRPGDLVNRIRTLLRQYHQAGGERAELLIHAGEAPPAGSLEASPGVLPLAVEEVASVGPEGWLSALAYGARRVWIAADESVPERVSQALQGPLRMVSDLLRGLDYPADAVVLGTPGEVAGTDLAPMPVIAAAQHAAMDDKRTSLYLALDHLHEQAARSKPLVTLEVGAPFGAAEVEGSRCTLCMACASACPGHALQDGQGEPQLRFIEANCLQCGICTRTCPEDAIWITPRLLLDREARSRPRVLHQEEPFCCVNCGKPFATRTVIDNMLEKLAGHWMFQSERSLRRLQMCDDCRVVDVVQDDQMMQGEEMTRQ